MKDIVIIDQLNKVTNNKYEAVRVMAKEARRINSVILHSEVKNVDAKPTSMAMRRMLEEKIKFEYVEEDKRELKDRDFDSKE
jgi:DNA-directed RNA polymerase subunit K/omega